MARVLGIGGIFFKTEDPGKLNAWYEKNLGIVAQPSIGGATFNWRHADDPEKEGITLWTTFPASTKYFGNSKAPFMINYIVDDLDGILKQAREQGVEVDERVERSEFGNFGWLTDPDGNRVELWEPK